MSNLTLDVSGITKKFRPVTGDVFVVTLPLGTRPEEAEHASEAFSEILRATGASAIFITAGTDVAELKSILMDWVADQGCAIRGYNPPGSDVVERRFRVLHPTKGQLSDAADWMTAVRMAQIAVGPQTPPQAMAKDSQAVLSEGG